MTRPYSAEWLDEITAASGLWRRKCNGHPDGGMPVDRHGLRIALGQSDRVAKGPDGLITWYVGGRKFTAEPVLDHGMEAGAGAPA
jgi:hypothetical protein